MMDRIALARWIVLVLTVAVLSTCADSTAPSAPVWLQVRLTTPNFDDGGVLFSLTGPQIDSVRTSHPYLVVRMVSAAETRIAVAGTVTSGVIAEVLVSDPSVAEQFQGRVREVVVRQALSQRPTNGYAIRVLAVR